MDGRADLRRAAGRHAVRRRPRVAAAVGSRASAHRRRPRHRAFPVDALTAVAAAGRFTIAAEAEERGGVAASLAGTLGPLRVGPAGRPAPVATTGGRRRCPVCAPSLARLGQVAADEPAQDLHGLLGYDVPAHRIRHRALQRVGARVQVLDGDGDAAVISAFRPARSFPPKRLSAGDESAAAQKTNVSGGAPCDYWRPSQGVGGPSQGGSTLPLGLVSRVGVIRP
jgi:hypothetical protein